MATGVRIGELAQARWKDVFLDARDNTGLLVVGKGQRPENTASLDDSISI
ncbi:MAG: hypothetical protein ACYC9X_01290 [Dehalococcoidia bacterium]